MGRLSSQDYDKLIDFYTEINRDYAHFKENVLSALAELFDIRLTAYAVYKSVGGKLIMTDVYSETFHSDLLLRYRETAAKDDPLILNYQRLCYENPELTYLTDKLLKDIEGSEESAHKKEMDRFFISQYAVIGVNSSTRNLMHLIHVFRQQQFGEFSEKDLELFGYIGKLFNKSKALYTAHMQQTRLLESTVAYTDTADFGFAILDYKGRIINQNSVFKKYSARLSPSLTDAEVISDILGLVAGDKEIYSSPNFAKIVQVSGFEIIVRKKRVQFSYTSGALIFITISSIGSRKALSMDSTELRARYGFSKRESEVAELMLQGFDNQSIAERLYISLATVKTHISHIFRKTDVNSRTELIQKLRFPG